MRNDNQLGDDVTNVHMRQHSTYGNKHPLIYNRCLTIKNVLYFVDCQRQQIYRTK